MDRIPVDSSNVCAVAYEPKTQVMEVEFGKGTDPGDAVNRLYRYRDVPPDVHGELMDAPSVGSYLNQEVAGKFPYEFLGRIEDIKG